MDRLLQIQLATPEIKTLPDFEKHTRLLREMRKFDSMCILAFVDPSAELDPSVRGNFADIAPKNGKVTVELAVELTDFLPNLTGSSEYIIAASAAELSEPLNLCFSNRMARYDWVEEGRAYHTLMPRRSGSHGFIEVGATAGGPTYRAIETLLKTMVAVTFTLEGDTAEEAIEKAIKKCVQDFCKATNHCLDTFGVSVKSVRSAPQRLSYDRISHLYLMVSNSDLTSSNRLALGARQVLLIAGDTTAEETEKVLALAKQSSAISVATQGLNSAWVNWQAGDYRFALLDAVIAAEVVTSETIRDFCALAGISNTVLKDQRDSMTFSWSLNVGVRLWTKYTKRQVSEELLVSMNQARKWRNDLMHRGEFHLDRQTTLKIIEDTAAFIEALRRT